MSYKLMIILNMVVALGFGLAFLVVPEPTLGFFGAETYVSNLLLGRFFGSAMVSIGLLLWFAKDIADASIQRGIGIALMTSAILGLIVNVIGVSPASGVIRSNGWITIIVYVLFALGYAFLVFLKPKMKE